MRSIALTLLAGSVIALLVGVANASGHIQIGGDDGFILRGWVTIVGAVLLGVGAAGFLWSYEDDRIMWQRAALPLVLMASAGVLLVAAGETPAEFCGSAAQALGPECP
jgi:hypothetical protein